MPFVACHTNTQQKQQHNPHPPGTSRISSRQHIARHNTKDQTTHTDKSPHAHQLLYIFASGPREKLESQDARVHCSTTKHHTHQHPPPHTVQLGAKEALRRSRDPSGPNSVPRPPTRTSRPGSTPTSHKDQEAVLRSTTHRGSPSSTIPLANTTIRGQTLADRRDVCSLERR